MKVTLNWLKQYVQFSWTAEELAERLTMLGLEVEGMQKLTGEFEGIVVAQILTSQKHPNADKLSVCQVADGGGQRQIVCGATNYRPGDKVPLILPGSSLPAKPGQTPVTIKAGKIRGVQSQGMMCSPQELGLAEESEGLMILPADAKVGQPFAEHLGRAGADVVYDLEITPNRPDLNSVLGIAREIAALTGHALCLPPVDGGGRGADQSPALLAEQVRVRIDDPELCPRYVARMIRGVRIGPSPRWLRALLEKVGLRSINNVVDVTNYVMLESGQPLHAFDYRLLGKTANAAMPVIVVRRAADGEKFTTLDGQTWTLNKENLLIADETKAIALAGVMGGQNTEINVQTSDVLLESAYFKPQNIRATAKQLGLRTDASYRFERGADIGITDWASRRAVQLILETAGGQWVEGGVDEFPAPILQRTVTLRYLKTNQLLGTPIPADTQKDCLRRLGLEITDETPDTCTIRVPTYRVDLTRETDLIEEAARLYGVDKIPPSVPRGALGSHALDVVHDELAEARRLLTGLGLDEAQGQTLISSATAGLVTADVVPLENPLSSDMNVLRPSLLPGLIDSLRHNLSHKNCDVALFEIGRVFSPTPGGCREERRVAMALTGQRLPTFWQGDDRMAKFDSYDLKGLVDEFLARFGLRGVSYVRRTAPASLLVESAVIQIGKQPAGELGQLQPVLAKQYDLRDAVLLAELNLDILLARRATVKGFKALPAFPAIRRDVAMLISESTTHDAVLAAVKQAKPAHLESVELFDVFRGKNIPAEQKSVAYAFTYRHPDRTLTDAEVNAAHQKLIKEFKEKLQATIRDS